MKKLNTFGLIVALGLMAFTPVTHAADRCAGKVSAALIHDESVSDMYFDMRVAQMQCGYVEKDQTVLNSIAAAIDGFEKRYTSCIEASQNAMVAYLGSEGVYENFDAALGNQIALLNLNDPCGRASSLSVALMKKPMTCGAQMAAVYAPYFAQYNAEYIAKEKEPLHRICDHTDQ